MTVSQELLWAGQRHQTGWPFCTPSRSLGHYGVLPKACRPYRAETKGKVERPFRYVREDFFLARTFRNLDDLNAQLDQVANRHRHATTGRVLPSTLPRSGRS